MDDSTLELSGSRVLVTGATGRVGRTLSRQLALRGASVSTVVLPDDPGRDALPVSVHATLGSLADLRTVEVALDGVDLVVHLAALMDWSAEANHRLFDANVTATFNLLHVAAKPGRNVQQVVIASSDEVYPALQVHGVIHEDLPTSPYSFYGLTKLLDEEMAEFYQRAMDVRVSIARFSLTAEPAELLRADGWSGRLFFASGLRGILDALGRGEAVAVIDASIARPESTLLLARDLDGLPYAFQFCDVRDLVDGLLLQLTNPAAAGRTFNLSGPRPTLYDEAVPAIAEATGLEFVDLRLPGPRIHVETSIEAARKILGYQPRHDLPSILNDAVESHAVG